MKASELIKTLRRLIMTYGDGDVARSPGVIYNVIDVQEDFMNDEVWFIPLAVDITNPKVSANEK